MTPLKWSDGALEDLRSIRQFFARDSELYADRVLDRIKGAAERLQSFPLLGEVVQDIDRHDVREIVAGSYRILYRPTTERVAILAVVHGARELPPMSSIQ